MVKITAVISKLTPDDNLKWIKNKVTGEKEAKIETIYTLKAALKKEKYGKDENLVKGTGNPYGSATITGLFPDVLQEFEHLEIGDEVVIEVTPVKKPSF
jgi:hypothetical protein